MKKLHLLLLITLAPLLLLTFCKKEDTNGNKLPTIETREVTEIALNTAKSGGVITDDGGFSITERGVVWSDKPEPTIADSKTEDGAGVGEFTSLISDLEASTRYYVRAYAKNKNGVGYGMTWSFVTSDLMLPDVITFEVTDITQSSAISGGNIINNGGAAVTTRGVVWGNEPDPTTDNNSTDDGMGVGEFTSFIRDLEPSTRYYIRAYAINTIGTSYGDTYTFVSDEILLPEVITIEVYELTQTSARTGGIISSDSGESITARGVVFSTSQLPTIEDNLGVTNNGEGAGEFTSLVTELVPDTYYYLRAYAKLNNGTSYGNQIVFKTLRQVIPCPESPTISDIDGNIYNTVLIDEKCWMKENLKTTRYQNGNQIEYPGSDNAAWQSNTSGAFAWYNNDVNWKSSYGGLYNWHAVSNENGLCPEGWHVPSNNDWSILVDYLQEEGFPDSNESNGAGNALKSCRQIDSPLGSECATTEHPRWSAHNSHFGFDEFGFSALPGGYRLSSGNYSSGFNGSAFEAGAWWTTSEASSSQTWSWTIYRESGEVPNGINNITKGLSIRCIKY